MSDVKSWSVEETDVEWLMEWTKGHPRKEKDELVFEAEKALAVLLINEVVFINEHWWKHSELYSKPEGGYGTRPKENPEWSLEDSRTISVAVNCNDCFAWGCADAETLPYDQIETVYKMWRKDPEWGAYVWCMIQRKEMPQKPVEDRIRAAGIWNLDELMLPANTMDAEVSAIFAPRSSATTTDPPSP